MSAIDSIANQSLLAKEGLVSPNRMEEMRAQHKMTLFYRYLDPANANNHDRPVVDVSTIMNPLDERFRNRFGVAKGAFLHFDLNHFTDLPEVVPYATTMHNSDFLAHGFLLANFGFMNWYAGRAAVGGHVMGHPHTQWAHTVVFCAGLLRSSIACALGLGGSLYTYEYLYTHVPGFRIADPSTNGWRAAHREGQTTYLARMASVMWWPLAVAFYTKSMKRFHFNTGAVITAAVTYEAIRSNASSMNSKTDMLKMRNMSDHQGSVGSLVPDQERRLNIDTERPAEFQQSKYMNYQHSAIKALGWENCTFDNAPINPYFSKKSNHLWNWTLERGLDGERKYRFKNETWDLPRFMDAKMATSAMDRVPIA